MTITHASGKRGLRALVGWYSSTMSGDDASSSFSLGVTRLWPLYLTFV
jgi:hypothetical protein